MLFSLTFLSAVSVFLLFQDRAIPVDSKPIAVPTSVSPSPAAPAHNDNDALGPGDQIMIRAIDVEEIDNKPVFVDRKGNIDMPVVGKLQAAGLTPDQLENAIKLRLTRVLRNPPDVSISVMEVHSQGVSVLGAVTTPGVHQLQGDKTLFEVLSLAGGLRTDAGYTVIITRQIEWGPIPLPTAILDSTGRYSVASVSVKSIMAASNPAENIYIKPNDVISVPRADIIYVIGAVKKAGGYALNDNGTRSALQILSLAEGLEKTAAGNRAKIMRGIPGSNNRDEIPIDLKQILAGKSPDVPLKADDILFVPTSGAKTAAFRTIDILTASATSFIYRLP
ncbi:MAG: polysaccharide biosynthesis/export family protein [Bryobacteraceae bacterium]|jgi:polysaccharide export outer membrane protein